MGIKTDYLKDCLTNKTITVQEIINLKNSLNSASSPEDILSQVQASIDKLDANLNLKLEETKKQIEDEVDAKLKVFEDLLNALKIKVDEIYNKVVAFQFKEISNIERNMNNDLSKIEFTDKSYIIIEYINLPYQNEFINYMPSKLNYYANDKLIAIEEIKYQNESIIGFKNINI